MFRIHLIYSADGLTRPLSFRQDVAAESCAKAKELAENFIRSAYISGYETLSWSAENLDLRPRDELVEGEVINKAAKATLKALAQAKQSRGK